MWNNHQGKKFFILCHRVPHPCVTHSHEEWSIFCAIPRTGLVVLLVWRTLLGCVLSSDCSTMPLGYDDERRRLMPKKKPSIHGTQVCNGRKTHDLQYYCDKSKNSVYLHGLDLAPLGKLVRIVPWHTPTPQTGKLEEHFLLVIMPSCFYYCSCNCQLQQCSQHGTTRQGIAGTNTPQTFLLVVMRELEASSVRVWSFQVFK